MSERTMPLYSPALRMKTGEGEGLRLLASDVASHVFPRFIVPPSGDRDEAVFLPFELDRKPDIAPFLAGVWRGRTAMVDATYIIDEFGRDRLVDWLPGMFERARSRGVYVIPAALLSDIKKGIAGFRASISQDDSIKFAIRLQLGDIEISGKAFPNAVAEALRTLSLTASECVVIADFVETDFTNPALVTPIISSSLERLQEIGLWKHIIFQGSNYPEINPKPDGGTVLWPRNEWQAWRRAVTFDVSNAENMIFGDYAADCSKIEFGDGGGRPIRHLRYTSGENWRIQCADRQRPSRLSMHEVYESIASSTDFAGTSFSRADRYIGQAAADIFERHGNPTTWRQLNTTHHVTQVVSDIAGLRGLQIKRTTARDLVQPSFLPWK